MDRYISFERVTEHSFGQGVRSKLDLVCRIDGHRWGTTTVNSLFHGETGCPKCSKSLAWDVEKVIERRGTTRASTFRG